MDDWTCKHIRLLAGNTLFICINGKTELFDELPS